jgi:hypothetical protein
MLTGMFTAEESVEVGPPASDGAVPMLEGFKEPAA